jgi:hypothetical protein
MANVGFMDVALCGLKLEVSNIADSLKLDLNNLSNKFKVDNMAFKSGRRTLAKSLVFSRK